MIPFRNYQILGDHGAPPGASAIPDLSSLASLCRCNSEEGIARLFVALES